MGAQLDFDPWVQAKAILYQILIHLLLSTEPGGILIEVHPDPGMMKSSLLLLLRRDLFLTYTTR